MKFGRTTLNDKRIMETLLSGMSPEDLEKVVSLAPIQLDIEYATIAFNELERSGNHEAKIEFAKNHDLIGQLIRSALELDVCDTSKQATSTLYAIEKIMDENGLSVHKYGYRDFKFNTTVAELEKSMDLQTQGFWKSYRAFMLTRAKDYENKSQNATSEMSRVGNLETAARLYAAGMNRTKARDLFERSAEGYLQLENYAKAACNYINAEMDIKVKGFEHLIAKQKKEQEKRTEEIRLKFARELEDAFGPADNFK